MRIILSTLLTAAIVSCASNPDKINATYVSPLKYSTYDCNQIAQEMGYLEQRTNTLYQSLKKKSKGDAWQMGVGVVLFWPTLFALEGGDGPEATEYAQIKGEYKALRENAVTKSCNIELKSPDEILNNAKEADVETPKANQQAGTPLEEKLKELEKLKKDGLINEDEYQAAKKKALGI